MSGSNLPVLLSVFLLTYLLSWRLRPLAERVGLIDHPDERRRHEIPTPLCGGLAMLVALAVVASIEHRAVPASPAAMAGIGLVLAIGVVDDRWQLRAVTRLGCQTLAASLIVVYGAAGQGGLGGIVNLGLADPLEILLGLGIAIGLVVGLINSMNMIDGVDGLAGSVALSAFFWLSAVALTVGNETSARHAELFMAATAGFLVLNLRHRWRPRALVFLGDGGSTALGAAVGYLIVKLCAAEGLPLASLLWIAAVPVIDTLSLIVRRIAAGQSPFRADRQHLHHVLLDLGLRPGQVTAAMTGAAFLCGAIGFAGIRWGIPGPAMAVALVVPAAAHTAVVQMWRTRALSGDWIGAGSVKPDDAGAAIRAGIFSRRQVDSWASQP